MPRPVRALQIQFHGQQITHRYALVSQCRKGPTGPAKLQVCCLIETTFHSLPAAPHSSQPTRSLQSKRDRWCRLQQSAPQHYGIAVLIGNPPQRLQNALMVTLQYFSTLAQQQHHARVDDVLAGCTPMHKSRGLSVLRTNRFSQHADHRNGWRSSSKGFAYQSGNIKTLGHGHLGNHPCRIRWNQPNLRFSPGQRPFEAQHGLQNNLIRENFR